MPLQPQNDKATVRSIGFGIVKTSGKRQTGLLVEPYVALDIVVEIIYPASVVLSSPDFQITLDNRPFPHPAISIVARSTWPNCVILREGAESAAICIQYELKSANFDTDDVRFLSTWDHNTLTVDFTAYAQVGTYEEMINASTSTLVYWTNL